MAIRLICIVKLNEKERPANGWFSEINDLNFDRSSTWANPVKTEGSKQRYSFDRHETVFSNGLYHVTYMSELSPTYRLKQIEPVIRTMCFYIYIYILKKHM